MISYPKQHKQKFTIFTVFSSLSRNSLAGEKKISMKSIKLKWNELNYFNRNIYLFPHLCVLHMSFNFYSYTHTHTHDFMYCQYLPQQQKVKETSFLSCHSLSILGRTLAWSSLSFFNPTLPPLFHISPHTWDACRHTSPPLAIFVLGINQRKCNPLSETAA